MPPSQTWSKLRECRTEDAFDIYRWQAFCCSVVRGVRPFVCSICPGDHEMIERDLHYKSVTCEGVVPSTKCPVRWKVRHCPSGSIWVVLSSGEGHHRGDIECAVSPRPKVTPEMKSYIHRMDENAVPPRLIWSNLLRAPDVLKPVLGYASYAQVQRSARKWRGQAAIDFGDYDFETLRSILALQNREPFLIFHLDATFKLSDLGYLLITCELRANAAFTTLLDYLSIDAAMGDAEAAQLNALGKIIGFDSCKYLMCFFHVLYNVRKRIVTCLI
ncbi:hypothetical protein GQ600_16054 [Phytophthora cactorum]|nr:hypothetical protein GQ600_16054 [Phytophthora cactorum]